MTRKATEQARKVRWTVPGADVSVCEWLDEQENLSQSLRLLIRESIQRDGYIDVAYKPVEQLPRRGRPPQSEQSDKEPQEQPGQPEHSSTDSSQENSGNPAGTAYNPASQEPDVAASSASGDAENTDGPMDMDSIFGQRR